MITTDPRAIPTTIIETLRNLAGWIGELSDERLEDISGTLRGAINSASAWRPGHPWRVGEDDPVAGLLAAYRLEVLTEIDRRRGKGPFKEPAE